MGAVYKPSLKDSQKVLKCSDREISRLSKQMSTAIIKGSMAIWRLDTCARHEGHLEQDGEIIQEEVNELQGVGIQRELHGRERSEEEDEIDGGVDELDDEEERDVSEQEQEREDERDRPRGNGEWNRGTEDEGRGEHSDQGSLDGDQGRSQRQGRDDTAIRQMTREMTVSNKRKRKRKQGKKDKRAATEEDERSSEMTTQD
jgi:hypothetical protein